MSFRFLRMLCFGLLTCCLSALPALSQGHGKGKGHDKHGDDDKGHGNKRAKHDFDDHDREVVTQYYAGRGSGLPPGLAKRGGNLPPGLEKHLERNGTLPPGLQKRMQPCPAELERVLPPPPPNYAHVVIGGNLVLLNRANFQIADVFHFQIQ